MISIFQQPSRGASASKQAENVLPVVQFAAQPKGSNASALAFPAAAVPQSHAAGVGDLGSLTGVKRRFKWLQVGRAKKRLQMLETVSLGEKRFVALVQVDGRQFLIGGAPSNVGMLAELAPEETFHQVLRDATQGLETSPAPTASSAAQPPFPAPEPPVQAAAPLPALVMEPEADTTKPTNSPERASPVFAESPFSLSPTMLAMMGAESLRTGGPEAHVQQEPAADQRSVAEDSEPHGRSSAPFADPPSFTFQMSPVTPLTLRALPQQDHYRFGTEAAPPKAVAWKLKGVTS